MCCIRYGGTCCLHLQIEMTAILKIVVERFPETSETNVMSTPYQHQHFLEDLVFSDFPVRWENFLTIEKVVFSAAWMDDL